MRLASLASLLFASFTGKLVYAVASIAALPLVAKMLGAESVGLVGFFQYPVDGFDGAGGRPYQQHYSATGEGEA